MQESVIHKDNKEAENTCIPVAKRASLKLIEQAAQEGWIRQLAFYHKLKLQYNNSCIYDYRQRMNELAEIFGISGRTLFRYIKVLKEKGLAKDHASNLQLKSITKYTSRWRKRTVNLSPDYSLFDISCSLYSKMIEQKARKQAFVESVRRMGRRDRRRDVPCETFFLPSFSYRTIAKIINCSEYKAYQVIQNLNRLGVLRTDKQKPRRMKDYPKAMLKSIEDLPGYQYAVNGIVYEIFGSKHEFLEFPLFLRHISIKKYRQFLRGLHFLYTSIWLLFFCQK